MRQVFKNSLMDKIHRIQDDQPDPDLELKFKVANYTRGLKMRGVNRHNEKSGEAVSPLKVKDQEDLMAGRRDCENVLMGMQYLRTVQKPGRFNHELYYKKFIEDPLGDHKAFSDFKKSNRDISLQMLLHKYKIKQAEKYLEEKIVEASPPIVEEEESEEEPQNTRETTDFRQSQFFASKYYQS